MWDKLKAEWKTFVFAIVCISIEVYDSVLGPYLVGHSIVPEKYKWIDALVIPIGFLLLRRWRDAQRDN